MINLPYELSWGVDVAIKKLRPGASFGLNNTTFTHWNDPLGLEPPTWDEVMAQLNADRKLAEEWLNDNKE
jgi:hypothetical protein